MAKNQNTFAKRQREMEKKRKAEEKRGKKRNKTDEPAQVIDTSNIPYTLPTDVPHPDERPN